MTSAAVSISIPAVTSPASVLADAPDLVSECLKVQVGSRHVVSSGQIISEKSLFEVDMIDIKRGWWLWLSKRSIVFQGCTGEDLQNIELRDSAYIESYWRDLEKFRCRRTDMKCLTEDLLISTVVSSLTLASVFYAFQPYCILSRQQAQRTRGYALGDKEFVERPWLSNGGAASSSSLAGWNKVLQYLESERIWWPVCWFMVHGWSENGAHHLTCNSARWHKVKRSNTGFSKAWLAHGGQAHAPLFWWHFRYCWLFRNQSDHLKV